MEPWLVSLRGPPVSKHTSGHRPSILVVSPCTLLSSLSIITANSATQRVLGVKCTVPAAVITDIFAECPVDGFIRALSDLQLSKRPSTPGTLIGFTCLSAHRQSPRRKSSSEMLSFSAINIAVYSDGFP